MGIDIDIDSTSAIFYTSTPLPYNPSIIFTCKLRSFNNIK